MKRGALEKKHVEQLEKVRDAGRLQPRDEWLFEPPAISVEWVWVLEGFEEVSTDRQIGGMGGAGPVPFHSIDRYADREELTDEEYRLFRRLVRKLDEEYFDYQAERSKPAAASPAPSRSRRGRRG